MSKAFDLTKMLLSPHDQKRRNVCTTKLSRLVILACCVTSVVVTVIYQNIQTGPSVILYPKSDQGPFKPSVRKNGIKTLATTTALVWRTSSAATTKGTLKTSVGENSIRTSATTVSDLKTTAAASQKGTLKTSVLENSMRTRATTTASVLKITTAAPAKDALKTSVRKNSIRTRATTTASALTTSTDEPSKGTLKTSVGENSIRTRTTTTASALRTSTAAPVKGTLKTSVRKNSMRTRATTTTSVLKTTTAAPAKDSKELKFNHKHFTSFHKMAEDISKITWKNTRFKNIIRPQLAPPMLQKNVSILCMVTSTPRHEMTRAMAVNKTWGGRCTKLLFLFTKHRSVFEHVSLDVPDGRKHLTAKTMEGFRHIHKHYGDEFDWIVKADDDTYLIVENLRFLLSRFDPNEPAYLGYHFKVHVHNGYMSGGGSYVLSKAALRMLAERGFTKEVGCSIDSADEDVEVGRCMEKLGVKPFMTRDKFGRDSFHPQSLAEHMVGPMSYYLVYYPAHPIALGPECCSQLSISFHYVQHQMMYIVDMLLYRISVHGLDNLPPDQLEDFFIKNESKISHTSEKEIYRIKGRHEYNYFIP